MPLADTYPLLEVFWTMLIFFAFVIWLWLLWVVVGDLFKRSETSACAIDTAEFDRIKTKAIAT